MVMYTSSYGLGSGGGGGGGGGGGRGGGALYTVTILTVEVVTDLWNTGPQTPKTIT